MSNRSRPGRILRYLNVMFPPALMVPAGVANFLALYLGLQALAGLQPLRLPPRAWFGAAVVLLFSLLMRVYDEIKDVETDRRLAAAGDARFQDRPIVTGELLVEDLVFLRWTVTVLLIAAMIPVGSPLTWTAFAIAFFVMWLSFKWFFYPRIQQSLVLAFLTHNPITVLVQAVVVTMVIDQFAVELPLAPSAALCVALWFPVAAWETSRKVRIPEDETDYETYSKALGWKTAGLVPAAFVALGTAGLVFASLRADLPLWYVGLAVAAAAVPVGGSLAFRLAPTRARANLRPLVELYTIIVVFGLPLVLGYARGLSWR